MSHHDHQAASPKSETPIDLLLAFFPSKSDIAAFVGGVVAGAGILAVLTLIAFSIGGQKGIWATF